MKNKENIIVLDFEHKNHNSNQTEDTAEKTQLRKLGETLIFSLIALFIGAVVGIIDAFFGNVLLRITSFREEHYIYLIPFLGIAGLLIVFLYERFGKEIQNGMFLILERARNNISEIKIRLIPFVTLSTWITHLFGGSAGREGVAVQIGGTFGSFMAQKFNFKEKNSAKILTISGMAAGFGGLFRTPMAAIFFATEVLTDGTIEIGALLPSFVAAYTASFISGYFGLEKFSVGLDNVFELNVQNVTMLCLSGLIFGIVGGLFAFLMKTSKRLMSGLIENPYIRIFTSGAAISIASILLFSGRYSGLGTNIISAAFNGEDIYYWDFIVKMIFTIITISAGFQGGEVTPLFSIGVSLGAVIAMLSGMPVELFAAFGYAAVFGAATNTLIAPIFIGVEVFGFQYMPYFFAVCVIAYVSNGNNSIYSYDKRKKRSPIIKIAK